MILAAHQPNLMPWLQYFYKINKADIFIIMINCQYEKNGFQNRANVWEKWLTKPITNKTEMIRDKRYADGSSLADVNTSFILGMSKVLGINTSKIHYDFPTDKNGTERIIELCHKYECDKYLTNPDALSKYLDIDKLTDAGIELVPLMFPYRHHTFEALEEFGLEGTIKILNKEYSKCKV